MGAVVCRGEVGECALKKNSDGPSLPEERACLDCLMSKKPAEVGLQGAGRFIHHVQSQHRSPACSRSRLDEKNRAGQHFALKFLKRGMLGDVQVRENPESAVHAKDHRGKARRARTQSCSKNGGRSLWLQFDGMN